MTLKEARKRADYRFWTNTIEELRHQIIKGEFFYFDDYDEKNGVFEIGTACLEIGCVDIELNVCSDGDDDKYFDKPTTSYFLCVKGIENGDLSWGQGGYLDDFGIDVDVDWTDPEWRKNLERDMFEKLMAAVEMFDLKVDEPNWIGDEFAVFDRIHGIEGR